MAKFNALMVRRWKYVCRKIHSKEAFLPKPPPNSQLDKFKKLARELEADEDEKHWDERLKKVAKGKPDPEKPAA